MAEDQIQVQASAAPAQTMSALRDLLKVAGTALVTKGVISQDWIEPLIGAIVVIGPILWTQVVTRLKHDQLVKIVDAVPDHIATVVRK